MDSSHRVQLTLQWLLKNLDLKTSKKRNVLLVSLDVTGAFDGTRWPSIRHDLRDLRCLKNVFVLIRNYFKARTATIYLNNHKLERIVEKNYPQGSCCGLNLSNIMYSPLLNLQLSRHSKVTAYADDLAVMTEGNAVTGGNVPT